MPRGPGAGAAAAPAAVAAGAAALVLACGAALGVGPGPGPGHVVWVLDHAFRDAATGTPLTALRLGESVEFRVLGGLHTATRGAAGLGPAGPGGPDSPLLEEGEAYRFAPAEPGLVPYTCVLHAQMQGLLAVAPAAAAPRAAPPPRAPGPGPGGGPPGYMDPGSIAG